METVDVIILCVLMMMLGAMLGTSLVAALVYMSVREKGSPVPLQQQKEDPCETCLRWGATEAPPVADEATRASGSGRQMTKALVAEEAGGHRNRNECNGVDETGPRR